MLEWVKVIPYMNGEENAEEIADDHRDIR